MQTRQCRQEVAGNWVDSELASIEARVVGSWVVYNHLSGMLDHLGVGDVGGLEPLGGDEQLLHICSSVSSPLKSLELGLLSDTQIQPCPPAFLLGIYETTSKFHRLLWF